jgi:hypothetical protein
MAWSTWPSLMNPTRMSASGGMESGWSGCNSSPALRHHRRRVSAPRAGVQPGGRRSPEPTGLLCSQARAPHDAVTRQCHGQQKPSTSRRVHARASGLRRNPPTPCLAVTPLVDYPIGAGSRAERSSPQTSSDGDSRLAVTSTTTDPTLHRRVMVVVTDWSRGHGARWRSCSRSAARFGFSHPRFDRRRPANGDPDVPADGSHPAASMAR